MNAAELLADQIDVSRGWTLALVADLEGDEWMYQPADGLHHALWLCGHIAVAEHLLILTRCLGGDAPDPAFAHHFDIGGPVKSASEHDWPAPAVVMEKMAATHETVMAAVRGMSDDQLGEPCYGRDGATHPHYTTNAGAVAHCARHEGFHAGQIAMLRRLMGKGFLR